MTSPDPASPDPAGPHPGPLNTGFITVCLEAIDRGDEAARERLWSAVHGELHRMASGLMARERPGHTMQPTVLVNEVYARLVGGEKLSHQSHRYFFAAAAESMRRILIDHARRRRRRDGNTARGSWLLDRAATTGHTHDEDLDRLEESLDALRTHDQRVFDVIMLRFFAGLSVEHTATVLETSPRTVKRCWAYGRAWLLDRIEGDA